MINLRLLQVGVHLLSGLLQCALLFPFLSPARRNALVRRWSRGLLRVFRVRLVVSGPGHGEAAGAVVANHVSWIDVFVLNAIGTCRFVAKSEVRGWPAIGWLSARAGTIYVARGARAGLLTANATIAAHLGERERLAFFPEGTSGPQGSLLPFHANLFHGVIAADAPVHPVAIAYVGADGQLSAAAEYIGAMSLWDSIVSLLRHGPFEARVALLAPIASTGIERRELAVQSQAAIGASLAQCQRPPDTSMKVPVL
ncbi:lysophospholipid acyltransferase family protein [Massilia sp. S19_KUP03_FR1]|uniref:lysophospholipid acyltransferase family protein n=1 Tax=Massilia sp. S19_KUP03_FR1 TaxID=3025503 RepID=UPI002FCD9AFD